MRKGKPKSLLEWDLAQLLSVAKPADWLPAALDLNKPWEFAGRDNARR
jgi:hypothetical protein